MQRRRRRATAPRARGLRGDLRAVARLRALRPVPARVPDLPRDRPRDVVAARAHLPDARRRGGPHPARRRRRRRGVPVPRLSRLRDRLSVRRPLRRDARARCATRCERAGLRRRLAQPDRALRAAPRRAASRAAAPRVGPARGSRSACGSTALARRCCPRALRDARALLPRVPRAPARARRCPSACRPQGERRGRVALLRGLRDARSSSRRRTPRRVRVLARERLRRRGAARPGLLRRAPGARGRRRDGARARAPQPRGLRAARRRRDRRELGRLRRRAARRAATGCRARASRFAAQVRDVCEWLDEVGLRAPLGRLDARVCYDDPCHLVHGQRVGAAPRRLLAAIPGLDARAARRSGRLLRRRGHLQPDAARDVARRARAQDRVARGGGSRPRRDAAIRAA